MEDQAGRETGNAGSRARFQILSLDGGGLKGLFAATVLAQIEADLGVDLLDHFDLVAGTSTGGIIALALGHGMRPAEIVDLYTDLGPAVFGSPRSLVGRIRSPKHSADLLHAELRKVFGDAILGDSRVPLIIPAYSLDAHGVYVFKTPHDQRLIRDWKVSMVDVAMATSAAPTFLPAYRIGSNRLIDGGVWANNPALIAIAEARSLFGAHLDDIRLLSLGTTEDVKPVPSGLDTGGLSKWGRYGAATLLDAAAAGTHATTQHLIGTENLHRIDRQVAGGVFKLDRVHIEEMAALAEHVSRHETRRLKDLFLDHRPTPYTPLQPSGATP